MKKFLSVLFASLLLATTLSAATPQKGRVLAEGNPPLTRAMADDVASFFEWLFEARLDAAKRAELDEILVATWRRDDRGEIKAVAELGELRAKLASAGEEKRREVREAMLPEVLRQLRADGSDFSRLLLGLYESRGAGSGDDAAQDSGDASGLLGAWRSTQLGMINYQNTITGAQKPGRGTTMQYSFQPNGRYEYNGYMEMTVYNCTTTYFNPVKGRYRVEGSRVVLTPETNRWQSRNNCAASMNKDLPGKLDPEVYAYRVATEQGQPRLCLTSQSGNEVCYRRDQ